MKNERKIILLAVFMSIFGATFCSSVKADLTFGEISVSPLSPAAQSTITISIPISGETPSEVKVRIEECNGRSGICFSDVQNVSMPLISMGNYQTSVTLRHAEATYFNCTVLAKINGTWTPPAKWKWKIVNLSENSNGNTNGNGNDGNGIPGFELVLVVIAIGLSLIVTGRKRAK